MPLIVFYSAMTLAAELLAGPNALQSTLIERAWGLLMVGQLWFFTQTETRAYFRHSGLPIF